MTIDAAFTGFPSLTTNRLFLRQIRPTDAEDLYATFSDEEAMRYCQLNQNGRDNYGKKP